MPRVIVATGAAISAAGGRAYRITQAANGDLILVHLPGFGWSPAYHPPHRHYEVEFIAQVTYNPAPPGGAALGSLWVPVSTHPPASWVFGPVRVAATDPGMELEDQTPGGANIQGTMERTFANAPVYRPKDIVFWIPDAQVGAAAALGLPEETSLQIDL